MKTLLRKTSSILLIIGLMVLSGCQEVQKPIATEASASAEKEQDYSYTEYPLERKGIALHLDKVSVEGTSYKKNILLIHGVTYSSHEFDINYKDYSLVRALADAGYNVWRLDIAGFGRSGKIEDGFMPDSDYAAEDINAAVESIVKETGQEKVDVLGWSWGTVTVGRFAALHPEHLNKVVLYAPILCGVGEAEVKEPFHHNTWEHAADDFQKKNDGTFDGEIAEAVLIEAFCSSCWHYDGESSPNGGRRDICVSSSKKLMDLSKIKTPTLIICGDKDPYLNYELVNNSLSQLPEGSALEVIKGGSHVVYIEKPYYKDFRDRLLKFLG
ncbi:MAG: alpha/beta hydrolase [Lachnospiraceae bacterium]|nr:alpha/beta hydrolase [Lachnospiraceae bacterium]